MHFVEQDRGLGTAYERYVFYQLLDSWATKYEIETFLEGPVDHMAGIAGVFGAGLAKRGIKVVSAVEGEPHASAARAVYQAVGADADVRVVGADLASVASLPKSDMVLTYHALSFVDDWRKYLETLASLAKKALVVAVRNPDNWGVSVEQAIARVRGIGGFDTPECWRTDVLAPELWKYGRVRDHAYFDCPWWPDLHVKAGQSLGDRIRVMFRGKSAPAAVDPADTNLAQRFVYDGKRWPYFGGEGWVDELHPGLLKHPTFEASSEKVRRRTSHLHAFVVDLRPRTPRQRRHLAQVDKVDKAK